MSGHYDASKIWNDAITNRFQEQLKQMRLDVKRGHSDGQQPATNPQMPSRTPPPGMPGRPSKENRVPMPTAAQRSEWAKQSAARLQPRVTSTRPSRMARLNKKKKMMMGKIKSYRKHVNSYNVMMALSMAGLAGLYIFELAT